jgi:hypothetical protein
MFYSCTQQGVDAYWEAVAKAHQISVSNMTDEEIEAHNKKMGKQFDIMVTLTLSVTFIGSLFLFL